MGTEWTINLASLREAWGHCEFVKHIKHAHVPARETDKFRVDDTDIDDWEIAN